MKTLTDLTLTQARHGLRKREFSAVELTHAYISALEKGRALNAYVLETPERALEDAKASDEKLAAGTSRPLEGIPLGIKDLFCTQDVRTTACSSILQDFIPPYESTVTANLWRDGAVMLGKLNNDEFAMGSSNENSCFGPTINPWRANTSKEPLVPGGSSGGSSAAVAAHLCVAATATDTGGSIRQPAAYTGTVGIKPTYGRCSRFGMIAFASSLDQAGPIARTVQDAAILLTSMSGHDPKDATSAHEPVPDFEAALTGDISGMTIGIPIECRSEGLSPEIDALWQRGISWLKEAGATVREVSLPHLTYALPTYYIIAPAEASSNLARYDGVRYGQRIPANDLISLYENTRSQGFGWEVKRRILLGTYVLSSGYYDAYYRRAQKVQALIKQDFQKVYAQGIDALLTPTTPGPAFPIGKKHQMSPVDMYLNDVFTVPVNIAELPAISIPAGLGTSGLPLGLQVIGRPFDEGTILCIAHHLETAAGSLPSPETWWQHHTSPLQYEREKAV